MGKLQIDPDFKELCVIWVEKMLNNEKNEKFNKLIQSLGDMSKSSGHLFILTEEILKKVSSTKNSS